MSVTTNLNDMNPAPPAGYVNGKWQLDTSAGRDASVYLEPFGGAVEKTADYTALTADNGTLIVLNGSSITLDLPAAIPFGRWKVMVANVNASAATIGRNGKTIDGAASDLTLAQGEGCYITTDGTNYLTGGHTSGGGGGGGSTSDDITNESTASGTTVTDALDGIETTLALKADLSGGLLEPSEFPTPTTSTFGGVKDVAAVTSKFLTSIVNGIGQLAYALLSGLSDVLVTSPADGDVFSYEASSSKWKNKAPSALSGINATQIRGKNVTSTTPVQGQTLIFDGTNWNPHFQQQLNHYWMACSGASGPTDAACCHFLKAASQTNGPTFVAASATDPGVFSFSTGTGANVSSNFGESTAQGVTRDILRTWRCRVKLTQTANVRVWLGLFSTVSTNMRTDTPAALYAAFRYSTAAGDSKWQCVTGTDASHQTVTAESTSSHVDATTYHTFEIQFDGTNFVFFIDGTQVGSQATNIPTSGTGLGTVLNIDNVNLANDRLMKAVYFGYAESQTDGSDGNV